VEERRKLGVADIVDSIIQVTMPVLCGVIGWMFLEVVNIRENVATLQEQQVRHEVTGELVADMRDALIRLETSQRYVEKEVRLLRELSQKNTQQ
jgi:biopolymer transport protein ExbB/TolQ